MGEPMDLAMVRSLSDDALRLLAERIGPYISDAVAGTTETEQMVTVAAAAARTNVHEKTVRRAIDRGDLEARRVAGCVRIPQEALQTWVASRVHRPRGSLHPRSSPTPPAAHGAGLRRLLDLNTQQQYAAAEDKKRPRAGANSRGPARGR